MNNSYNYSNFDEVSLNTDNELDHYSTQLELQQVSASVQESPTEQRIEHMLLSHSKYYIYCE